MLPNHPPLTVAEQFGTLEALHPGRIDLGIGRAPGTDRETARALRRSADGLPTADFAAPARGTAGLLRPRAPRASAPTDNPTRIRAIPAEGNEPAHVAARVHRLQRRAGRPARPPVRLRLPPQRRQRRQRQARARALPHDVHAFRYAPTALQPHQRVRCCARRTPTTAHWLHGSTRLSALRLKAGRPVPLPSPEEAAITAYSTAEQTVMAEATTHARCRRSRHGGRRADPAQGQHRRRRADGHDQRLRPRRPPRQLRAAPATSSTERRAACPSPRIAPGERHVTPHARRSRPGSWTGPPSRRSRSARGSRRRSAVCRGWFTGSGDTDCTLSAEQMAAGS